MLTSWVVILFISLLTSFLSLESLQIYKFPLLQPRSPVIHLLSSTVLKISYSLIFLSRLLERS